MTDTLAQSLAHLAANPWILAYAAGLWSGWTGGQAGNSLHGGGG